MQRTKYPPAFKDEAVKQVIDKYHLVVDVAKCLGIPDNALYAGVSKFKKADEPVSDQLQRLFQLDAPDQAWVTGITYISMHEAWL